MAALNSSTGHSHDGTSNNGPKLSSSGVTSTFTNGFTTVTGASGDYVQIADVSDSNNTKKALISDIVTLATPTAATQSDQETGSSTSLMVTPGRQHFHKSALKVWASFTDGGTASLEESYNVTSIDDNSTGNYDLNFTTALSTTTYCVSGIGKRSADTSGIFCVPSVRTTGYVTVQFRNASDATSDVSIGCLMIAGDI